MLSLLTSQERKVILFVLCLLVAGIGVSFYKKKTQKESLIDYQALRFRLIEAVDINRAYVSQLRSVPGIGEHLAQAIVEYRDAHGDFETIDSLMNVPGIKHKKLKKMKEYICISKDKKKLSHGAP